MEKTQLEFIEKHVPALALYWPANFVAGQLGITQATFYKILKRLKLNYRELRRQGINDFIKENHNKMRDIDMACKLGISIETIRNYRISLGIHYPRGGKGRK